MSIFRSMADDEGDLAQVQKNGCQFDKLAAVEQQEQKQKLYKQNRC